MRELTTMRLIRNLSRTICTCTVNSTKYAGRESKFLTKIMSRDRPKKKWYQNSDRIVPTTQITKKAGLPQNDRRIAALSKLFTKHITDLLATGEVSLALLGRGLDISRVRVTPDFNQVNVYWLARDSEENDAEIEKLTSEIEGPLRHELSQLRVMGMVPPIKFMKDKKYMKVIEVDRLLREADFGEDFVPTDPTLRLRSSPVVNVTLSEEVWTNIQGTENKNTDPNEEPYEAPLPAMRYDVLGLDHSWIMTKVINSLDKSKAAAKSRALNVPIPSRLPPTEATAVAQYLTHKQKKEAFTEFLMKRQYEEKRQRKLRTGGGTELDEEYELDSYSQFNDEDEDLDADLEFDSHEFSTTDENLDDRKI